MQRIRQQWHLNSMVVKSVQTSSVAAGFGQHGMPPPASDPDLWPFDLETGVQVASKVGNLPSKFGHARPLGSWIIRYVCDGRTDGWTKATLIAPFPTVGGIIKSNDSILRILIKCTLSHLQHMLCSLSTTSPTTKRLLNAKKSRLNSLNGPA